MATTSCFPAGADKQRGEVPEVVRYTVLYCSKVPLVFCVPLWINTVGTCVKCLLGGGGVSSHFTPIATQVRHIWL